MYLSLAAEGVEEPLRTSAQDGLVDLPLMLLDAYNRGVCEHAILEQAVL